jgi:phosphatidylglycerophosphate synthase
MAKESVFRHIPNSLTISRFFLALYFPYSDPDHRLIIILASLLTEFLDGFLSRVFSWGSRLGALLDPIADKSFVLSVAFTLFFETDLKWWEFLLFGTRDTIVFFGALFLFREHNLKPFFNIEPRMLGKIATTFQFAFLISLVHFQEIFYELLWLTILFSLLSGIDYLVLLFKNDFYRSKKAS